MTDKQLLKMANSFRDGIVGQNTSEKRCFMVTWPLQTLLSMQGVKTEVVEGELVFGDTTYQHFWLWLHDGRILDATADQFKTPNNDAMPKVYLGEKPKWYNELKKITDY